MPLTAESEAYLAACADGDYVSYSDRRRWLADIEAAARADAEARIAALERDLATFTAEPDILRRIGTDQTNYWYNQTLLADGKVSAAEARVAALESLLDRAIGSLNDAERELHVWVDRDRVRNPGWSDVGYEPWNNKPSLALWSVDVSEIERDRAALAALAQAGANQPLILDGSAPDAETLRALLERTESRLSRWQHGEDCAVWSHDDDDWDATDADAADEHCDCGMRDLVVPLRAALAARDIPETTSGTEVCRCGHDETDHGIVTGCIHCPCTPPAISPASDATGKRCVCGALYDPEVGGFHAGPAPTEDAPEDGP